MTWGLDCVIIGALGTTGKKAPRSALVTLRRPMATKTATQRRHEARVSYDAFLAACPTRQLLDTLSNKWVCLVLTALGDGPQRHSDLKRAIAGVSQKMLTQTLRELERDG